MLSVSGGPLNNLTRSPFYWLVWPVRKVSILSKLLPTFRKPEKSNPAINQATFGKMDEIESPTASFRFDTAATGAFVPFKTPFKLPTIVRTA